MKTPPEDDAWLARLVIISVFFVNDNPCGNGPGQHNCDADVISLNGLPMLSLITINFGIQPVKSNKAIFKSH